MPEPSKAAATSQKAKEKLVPERDLLAVKEGNKKLREKLAQTEQQVRELQEDIRLASIKVGETDEGEVSDVREYLRKKERELSDLRKQVEQQSADLLGREKSVRAKELANQYRIEEEALLNCDTVQEIESEALRLRAEKAEAALAKEKPPTAPPTTPGGTVEGEGVYEEGTPALSEKPVSDMTDAEFADFRKQQRQKALTKK